LSAGGSARHARYIERRRPPALTLILNDRPGEHVIRIDPDILYADLAIGDALEGNLSRLAQRARDGRACQDEIDLLVDIAEGKLRSPPHRPGTRAAAIKRYKIAQEVLLLEALFPQRKREAIVAQVAKGYGVTRGYVFKVLREINPERREFIERSAAALATFAKCTEVQS
jgi:hypothetical protein